MRNVLVGLLAMAGFLVGCQGPKGEFGSRNLVLRSVLEGAELNYYWHVKVSLPGREKLQQLHRVGDRLYLLTDRRRLLSLDAARGQWDWSRQVTRLKQPIYALVHVDGLVVGNPKTPQAPPAPVDVVIVGTVTDLVVMDRANGDILKTMPLPYAATSAGVTDGTYFYYGSTRGWYHAINLRTGLVAWELPAEGGTTAPLAFYEGVLYVASRAGVVYATMVGPSAQVLWTNQGQQSVPMHGPVTAGVHVDRRGLFVPCQDNRLYAYDRSRGTPLWPPLVAQGPLRDPVQASEQSLFQFAVRDRFYAVDVATGNVRWSLPAGRKVLAVLPGPTGPKDYLQDTAGNLLIVDEILGRVDASAPLTGLDLLLGNTSAPAVYGASRDGHIVCIRPRSAGRLLPGHQPTIP